MWSYVVVRGRTTWSYMDWIFFSLVYFCSRGDRTKFLVMFIVEIWSSSQIKPYLKKVAEGSTYPKKTRHTSNLEKKVTPILFQKGLVLYEITFFLHFLESVFRGRFRGRNRPRVTAKPCDGFAKFAVGMFHGLHGKLLQNFLSFWYADFRFRFQYCWWSGFLLERENIGLNSFTGSRKNYSSYFVIVFLNLNEKYVLWA